MHNDRADNAMRPSRSRVDRAVSATIVVAIHLAVALLFLAGARPGLSLLKANGDAGAGDLIQVAIFPIQRRAATPPQRPILAKTQVAPKLTPVPPIEQDQSLPSTDNASSTGASGSDAAGTVATADPSSSTASDVVTAYEKTLLSHIEQYRQYPVGARRDRVFGTVTVAFSMDRQGFVLGARITQSSGSDLLDREALATILRAQPLPAIPAQLPDTVNISLPIGFGTPN